MYICLLRRRYHRLILFDFPIYIQFVDNILQIMSYRPYQKSPSPEMPLAQLSLDDNPSDPELAKYLNRDYWESRKTTESPASPSAPSPMAQPHDAIPLKVSHFII